HATNNESVRRLLWELTLSLTLTLTLILILTLTLTLTLTNPKLTLLLLTLKPQNSFSSSLCTPVLFNHVPQEPSTLRNKQHIVSEWKFYTTFQLTVALL